MKPIFISALTCLGLAASGSHEGSLVQRAPQNIVTANPFAGDPQAQRAGAKLYARECAACHGINREGRATAPALAQSEIYQAPPGVLFWILRNGSLHTGMPSFAHLPAPQRWQIITFLQEARDPNSAPVTRSRGPRSTGQK